MHFIIELLVDLLVDIIFDGLIELIKAICERVARLFRHAIRFVRWIIEQRRQRRGMIYFVSGKSARRAADGPRIFDTGRRRQRRGRAAHEIG